ncbi:allantoicase [Lipingzhangella sp. LS1_29]|uniref:Probable allantoicase n=1 Tax=Lipingzhangella rawalii TaxID=2055835 RepID=A0ABU2H3H9_9ACTN|nr:allantoicase [Lipingzhangella rawalii]MDS1269179.1 allantoicase [Lipingzhangella rawalii]
MTEPQLAASSTGDAQPYAGGDPFADYRSEHHPFTALVDLADRRLGGAVLAANDEFFADRENLLRPEPPQFDPHAFGNKGKIMDGWETRRRRGADGTRPHVSADDHDWALIRLALPGIVRGVIVDTAHFRGNYPPRVSVEAAHVPGTPSVQDLLSPEVTWTEIVPPAAVRGHAANGFPVTEERPWTHLRLNQYPDGGIARLRVHGDATPDPTWLAALDSFDLAAVEHGGRAEDASDAFFSPPNNIILPGRSRKMEDGWENRRRRDLGNDWVRLRLAAHGAIRAVEVDTSYYLGNAAGWLTLSTCDATTNNPEDPASWSPVLERVTLQPDAVHRFPLDTAATATHVRAEVFPDGGIARLRCFGSLTATGRADLERRAAHT